MSSFKAIYKKQLKDTLRNPTVLIQFMIFPLLAFIITIFMDMENMADEMMGMIPYAALAYIDVDAIVAGMNANMPNLVTMQATIFAGMGLIPVVSGIIAEDVERKSLRFLKMAGLKPAAYLLGIGGVIFFISIFSSVAFTLIAGFGGTDFLFFTGAMLAGVSASIVLGATFGIMSANQQAASGLAMPVAMVLGFGPVISQFNSTVADVLHFTFTQQLNVIANYLDTGIGDTPLWESFAIIGANIAVLAIIFAVVYKRKGLAV
jgi:ABC-2 type transport system permease protein